MKKKLLAALSAAFVVTALMLTACGSQKEETSANELSEETAKGTEAETETGEDKSEGKEKAGSTELGENGTALQYMKDLRAADFVELGEYIGVEVAMDDYLESYIEYTLQNDLLEITDRTVELGDIVNIDYEGKLDGVAFEGGTAQGADLTIGSGQFISGFEEGCIGMEIGETKDVEAYFPDPYKSSPDLAGKTAIFTVTVNSISAVPKLTEEYVQSLALDDCASVEEYRAYLYEALKKESSYEEEKQNLAYQAVAETCEFKEAPAGMVQRMNDTLLSNLSSYASMYGIDVGTYVAAVYGGDGQDYEEVILEQAVMMAQYYLMLQAIADKEGLAVSDEELQTELAAEAESYGYESAEEYGSLIDIEAYREYLMTQKVLQFLSDNASAVLEQ